MFSRSRVFRALCSIALLVPAAPVFHAQTGASSPVPPFVVAGLGRGTVALDGPWQFHTGDDAAWAGPDFDDSHWGQIEVSKPWGSQGHWAYAGRAWYRLHIEIKDEPDGPAEVALYVPITSCTYQVYWNGRLIGSTDDMPGQSSESFPAAAVFKLGKPERGVLAFRAYSPPLDSISTGDGQGLIAVPRVGNPEAIRDLAARERSAVVRSRLLTVLQILTYAQLFLLAAVVWLRNRNQKLLFWMSAFLLSAAFWSSQDPILFPWTQTNGLASFMTGGTPHSFEDIALWYVLLYLLDLDRYPQLVRWTRILAWITLLSAILDTVVFYMPSIDAHALLFQILDAVFTAGFSVPEIFPLVLIAFAFRNRMDPSRRLVAIAAFLSDMYFVVAHTAEQGERYTRWTLSNAMTQRLFSVDGVNVSMPDILSLILVCAIVYAVYRYMVELGQRQNALQREFQNARELQQVLIPESLPEIPGFSLTSAYKPALEVGGDFFQIISQADGSTVIVLGDVSGKGLKAAMAVSLIVGMVRALASMIPDPGKLLAEINHRLEGRLQGGFATALALRLDASGQCALACAGHLPPFINDRELELPGALPLGLTAGVSYETVSLQLHLADRVALFTDGLLEARSETGELYGFDRIRTLFTAGPTAQQAAQSAVAFGQDDDITVLILTRLEIVEEPATQIAAPIPARDAI